MFAVEPGIVYNQAGAKYEMTGVTVTAKYDYLEIPVLLRVAIPTQGEVKPSVFLGPSLGTLMGAKMVGEATGGPEVEIDMKDFIKSTSISLAVGAGVAIPSGSGKVMLDVAYGMGLTPLDDTAPEADIKTSGILILAGCSFK